MAAATACPNMAPMKFSKLWAILSSAPESYSSNVVASVLLFHMIGVPS
jgi:hypothetical protein